MASHHVCDAADRATGCRLSSIVGEQALSDDDGGILAWVLLARFPTDELKRISPELVERHHESARNS